MKKIITETVSCHYCWHQASIFKIKLHQYNMAYHNIIFAIFGFAFEKIKCVYVYLWRQCPAHQLDSWTACCFRHHFNNRTLSAAMTLSHTSILASENLQNSHQAMFIDDTMSSVTCVKFARLAYYCSRLCVCVYFWRQHLLLGIVRWTIKLHHEINHTNWDDV